MAIKNGDFIEIEFVAKVKGGEVFDTNIKAEAEKAELNIKEVKPLIISVGHGMLIKGFDEKIKGKEIGKKYAEEFKPEEAFGKRNPQLMKMVPLKHFLEQKINPQRGMQLSLDGKIAKVLSSSGGRVLVDFNNPLAGKEVIYNFKINKKVTDQKERIDSLQDFFFRKKFDFLVDKTNKKITFKVPKEMTKFIELFSKPFEKIIGMGVSIKEEDKKDKEKK